jgi:hypothetical protein
MGYTVISDGGTVEYSSLNSPPVLYSSDGEREALAIEETDGYRAEIEYFLNCCRRNASPELCMPEESANAVALTRLMLDARKKNGEKIPCDL